MRRYFLQILLGGFVMKNNPELSSLFKALIDSRKMDQTATKKKRRRLGKQEFIENVFQTYSKYCETYCSFYYLRKFTAKAQNENDYFPQDFVAFYKKNLHLLKSDLDNYSVKYIDFNIFNGKIGNILNSESELPEFLFKSLCILLKLN